MGKCYLDSNILIAFKDESSPFHQLSKEIIKSLIKKSITLVISPLTLDEFLFQIYYLLPSEIKKKREVCFKILEKALRDILSLPDLKIVSSPVDSRSQLKVVRFMERYNLKPRDAYHLLIVFSQKIERIATFDSDFGEIEKVEIVREPLKE